MQIVLIRHGMTEGNKTGKYIGVTDEPLSPEGISLLKDRKEIFHQFRNLSGRLIVSPMKRCRQTAEILFENMDHHIVEELRECDFGAFENKNYKELSGSREYQEWIESNGTDPFPNGEDPEKFKERSRNGFLDVLRKAMEEPTLNCLIFVVHGGTIMSILEAFGVDEKGEKRSFYDWHVKNGEGYLLHMDKKTVKKIVECGDHGVAAASKL